jgi:hypothetical protein
MQFRKTVTVFLFAIVLISIYQISTGTGTSFIGDVLARVQHARQFFSVPAASLHESVIIWLYRILFLMGFAMTVLMTIDCALNKREVFWFIVLWLLGPFGGIVYLLYFQRQVTFPFVIWSLFDSGSENPTQTRRCSRCQRSGIGLSEYDDGKAVHYICDMCRAEMEIRRDLNTGNNEDETD